MYMYIFAFACVCLIWNVSDSFQEIHGSPAEAYRGLITQLTSASRAATDSRAGPVPEPRPKPRTTSVPPGERRAPANLPKRNITSLIPTYKCASRSRSRNEKHAAADYYAICCAQERLCPSK